MEPKAEAKIVRALAKHLADEQGSIRRWRNAGNACTYIGAFLWVAAIFAFWQPSGGHWAFALLAAAGGVCIGLGLWFATFVQQWPVVRQFVDAEKVRQRAGELDAQQPK